MVPENFLLLHDLRADRNLLQPSLLSGFWRLKHECTRTFAAPDDPNAVKSAFAASSR